MWRRRCSVKTEEDSVEGDGAGNIRKTSRTGKQGEKGERGGAGVEAGAAGGLIDLSLNIQTAGLLCIPSEP